MLDLKQFCFFRLDDSSDSSKKILVVVYPSKRIQEGHFLWHSSPNQESITFHNLAIHLLLYRIYSSPHTYLKLLLLSLLVHAFGSRLLEMHAVLW